MKRAILALFLIFAAGCVFFHISDVDIGFHIKTGELIVKNRAIPVENIFSFAQPKSPRFLHQWGGALAWYFVYLCGGYKSIIIFRVFVFLLTVGSVFLTLSLINKNHYIFKLLLCTIFAMVARHHFFERPLIFSALFFAVLQYLVFRSKNWKPAGWLILLLFVVWVNVHTGFIYGIFFLAAYFAGLLLDRYLHKDPNPDTFPQMIRIFLFSAAGIIIGALVLNIVNPNGIKGIFFTLTWPFEPLYHKIIAEYKTSQILAYKLFYATLFAVLAMALINKSRARTKNAFLFLGFSILAVRINRNILFYAIVAIPILFELGIATIKKAAVKVHAMSGDFIKYALLAVLWIVIFVSVIIPDNIYQFGFGLYKPFYPTEIFDFIKNNKLRGNIFNDMQLGGPMIWFLYPEYRVFIDGRFEAYEKRFWIDEYYHILTTKSGWEDMLDKYGVTACFLSYNFGEKEDYIGKVLQNSPKWKLVAFDDYNALFLKDPGQNSAIVSRYSYSYLRPLDDTLDFITIKNADDVAREARKALAFGGSEMRARIFLERALLLKKNK